MMLLSYDRVFNGFLKALNSIALAIERAQTFAAAFSFRHCPKLAESHPNSVSRDLINVQEINRTKGLNFSEHST